MKCKIGFNLKESRSIFPKIYFYIVGDRLVKEINSVIKAFNKDLKKFDFLQLEDINNGRVCTYHEYGPDGAINICIELCAEVSKKIDSFSGTTKEEAFNHIKKILLSNKFFEINENKLDIYLQSKDKNQIQSDKWCYYLYRLKKGIMGKLEIFPRIYFIKVFDDKIALRQYVKIVEEFENHFKSIKEIKIDILTMRLDTYRNAISFSVNGLFIDKEKKKEITQFQEAHNYVKKYLENLNFIYIDAHEINKPNI